VDKSLNYERRYKKWTKEEIFFLKCYYGILTCREIAKALKRTPLAIRLQAYKLGLSSDIPRGRKPILLKMLYRNVLSKINKS